MSSRLLPRATARSFRRLAESASALRRPSELSSFARRLAHFWFVWSALLIVHELGHAWAADRLGQTVRRVTIGAGPVLWRGEYAGVEGVLRSVPIAGLTKVADVTSASATSTDATRWKRDMVVLLAGMAATIAFGALFAVIVLARERATQRRWLWGRHVIADAVVLTLLNVLPVPPLDGGRAVLVATSALSGQSLPADALFWIQACGFALAIIPVALWTRWTESIDLAASGWALPAAR